MIQEETAHGQWPLPHPKNLLSEDVLRLRAALQAIDQSMHQLQLENQRQAEQIGQLQQEKQQLAEAIGQRIQQLEEAIRASLAQLRTLALAGL